MDSAAPCENNDYWTFSHIKTVPAGSVRMVNVPFDSKAAHLSGE